MNRALAVTVVIGLAAMIATLVWWNDAEPSGPAASPERHAATSPVGASVADRADAGPIRFRAQPLPFQYERGDSGRKLPVEPIGGGVAIADFDSNGTPDLFFAQGVPLATTADETAAPDAFVRNLGARVLENASASARLTESRGYGIGATAADFDADGFADVYITRYGKNTLYRNQGDGTFCDVSNEAAVACSLWSIGAAFADFDNDGDLDLFVANYFSFDPSAAPFARDAAGQPEYGAPAVFEGQPDVYYANEGDGRFTDRSALAGIADTGRGMGVLATDFDGDGRMDILVANDAQPNALWHNRGGWFEDVALDRGIAVNARGETEANMGIAYGDTNGDQLPDVLITHLVNEHDTLWRAVPAAGGTFFRDATSESGLALESRRLTGWGTVLADLDHDGTADLVIANGHLKPERNQPFECANPPLLWRGTSAGRFANDTRSAGSYFQATHQARGLAAGDLDLDGDLDLVVVHHHDASVALWNESEANGNSLQVRLVGSGLNRDAIGARVIADSGTRRMLRTLDGGGSYGSTSESRLHFGLGHSESIQKLEVRWPSGRLTVRQVVGPGAVTLREADE